MSRIQKLHQWRSVVVVPKLVPVFATFLNEIGVRRGQCTVTRLEDYVVFIHTARELPQVFSQLQVKNLRLRTATRWQPMDVPREKLLHLSSFLNQRGVGAGGCLIFDFPQMLHKVLVFSDQEIPAEFHGLH